MTTTWQSSKKNSNADEDAEKTLTVPWQDTVDSERYLELYMNLTESGSNIHAVNYNDNLLHCVCLYFSMVLKRPTHAQPTTVERPMPNKVRFAKSETQILLSFASGLHAFVNLFALGKGLA